MSKTIRIALASAMALGVLSAAPVASAQAEVSRAGGCSGGSRWEMKAGRDNGRIGFEYEVDQNRAGQPWKVTVRRDGHKLFSTRMTTRQPSGSFSLERLVSNSAGKDHFRAFARNLRTGEVCKGSATL